MDFYDKFIKLCSQNGVKPCPMVESIGIQKTAVSNWKSRKSKPTAYNLQKIADYFGVSIAYLKGETENPSADESKGEVKRLVGSYEDEEEQGFETVNINVNTLGDITELVECVKGLSSEKIQLLISVAKSMK